MSLGKKILCFAALLLLLLLFVTVTVDMIKQWNTLQTYNQSPLFLKTPEGLNQAYHPSVIYFENKWNGFHYWMVQTPYPHYDTPYRDRWEYPCVYASNDGKNWTLPKGATNPIDDLSEEGIEEFDFFSDPDLVFKNGQLECWYRLSLRKGDRDNHKWGLLLRKRSIDGTNWGVRDTLGPIQLQTINNQPSYVMSPALMATEEGYRMWYVEFTETKQNGERKGEVCVSHSNNGYQWEKSSPCTLIGKDIQPWHIDVECIDSIYWMTVFSLTDQSITLWSSEDGNRFNYLKELLTPCYAIGSYYDKGLYRACLIKDSCSYKLYFSADDGSNRCIGLMQGSTPMNLEIISINSSYRTFRGFISCYLTNKFFLVRDILKYRFR